MKLILLLLIASCSNVPRSTVKDAEEVVIATFPPEEIEVKPLTKMFTVQKTVSTENALWLNSVAKAGECLMVNEDFFKEIANHRKFTSTDMTPVQVSQAMRKRVPAVLATYYKRWGKVIAYRNPGDNVLYYNLKFNPTEMKYMLGTLVHEFSHLQGFDHSSASDSESVPYQLGDMAEKYAAKCTKP